MEFEQFEKYIRNKYDVEHFDLFDLKDRGAIELKLIELKKEDRGNGTGSLIMEELIDYADQNELLIVLSPHEIKRAKLTKWYRSLGFLPNKNRNKDFRFMNTMIRYPMGITRSKWIDLGMHEKSESSVFKYNLIEYGANEFSKEQLEEFDKKPTLTISELDSNYTIYHKKRPYYEEDFIVYVCDIDGNEVASVTMEVDDEGLTPYSLGVDFKHRRKGIATEMYKYAEKISGNKIVNNDDNLTLEGKKFRDSLGYKKTEASDIELTEKDWAYLYAISENNTSDLNANMMDRYNGVLYRKTGYHAEDIEDTRNILFWTSDISVANNFPSESDYIVKLNYSGKAWLIHEYIEQNRVRIKQYVGSIAGMEEYKHIEKMIRYALSYNSNEVGAVVIQVKDINKDEIAFSYDEGETWVDKPITEASPMKAESDCGEIPDSEMWSLTEEGNNLNDNSNLLNIQNSYRYLYGNYPTKVSRKMRTDFSTASRFDKALESIKNEYDNGNLIGYLNPHHFEDEIIKDFINIDGKKIYRAINSKLENINKDEIGIYWTWDIEKANNHWGNSNENFIILESKVKDEMIDWEETICMSLNPRYSGECEIRLIKGSKLRINNVYSDINKTLLSDRKFPAVAYDAKAVYPFSRILKKFTIDKRLVT